MMRWMGYLLFLFIVLPALELALLLEVGSRIGTLTTLGLIALTGVIGASLARWQGFSVLRRLQSEAAQGRLPAGPIADGVLILVAGALLITPGLLTDAFGFALLVPAFRELIKLTVWRRVDRAITEGRAHIRTQGFSDGRSGQPGTDKPIIDISDVEPIAPNDKTIIH